MSRKRHPWTPAQDAQLRELFPTHSAEKIALIMQRSRTCIRRRCAKLGMFKQPGRYAAITIRKRAKAAAAQDPHDMREYNRARWPKVTATEASALAGVRYGGDPSKPGTKAPRMIDMVNRYQGSGSSSSLA